METFNKNIETANDAGERKEGLSSEVTHLTSQTELTVAQLLGAENTKQELEALKAKSSLNGSELTELKKDLQVMDMFAQFNAWAANDASHREAA